MINCFIRNIKFKNLNKNYIENYLNYYLYLLLFIININFKNYLNKNLFEYSIIHKD